LESHSGEIEAFDVLQGSRLLRRRWKHLVGATVAAGVIAIVATFFVQPIWESRISIQPGVVNGESLEDSRILARVLESEAANELAPENDSSFCQPFRVQIVEATPGGSVAYIRVLARSRTPDEARSCAAHALEFVMRRHTELFEKAVKNSEEYQHTLTLVVKQLGDSVAKLESN
jgi:hypothetical protein